jgi:hypothetical protein
MMIIIFRTFFTALAVLSFLFFFWKKLKDDYSSHQIFTLGFYSLTGLIIGFIISRYSLENYWFWISMIGSFAGLLIGSLRFKMKFFEIFEAWTIGSLSILSLVYIYLICFDFSVEQIIHLLSILLLVWIFFYISGKYKRYVWYRSGKVGFSGLAVAGFYFIFRSSFYAFSVIMVRGVIWEVILSGVCAFICFVTLFNLSRKEI